MIVVSCFPTGGEADAGYRLDGSAVGTDRPAVAAREPAGASAGSGSADDQRHPLGAADRRPLERLAPGVRQPCHLLAPAENLAGARGLGTHPTRVTGSTAQTWSSQAQP